LKEITEKSEYQFSDLVAIMGILRGKNGCPWDKVQNHQSIKKNFLEEVYEAIEAIDDENDELLKEELGDVLLQVVFHSQMASEDKRFSIGDVIDGICQKLIRRHPHIFGEVLADTPDEVLKNWEQIKREEKSIESHTEAMRKVAKSMPALLRSYKVQQKGAKAGFDWKNVSGAWEKVGEEIEELKARMQGADLGKMEDELGDVLFSVVNVARFLKIDPEIALNKSCDKFIGRFSYVEKEAAVRYNKPLEEISLEDLDKIWEEGKNNTKI